MSHLVVRDDRELRRLENTIARIEEGNSGLRNTCLLSALKAERDELLRIAGRTGRLGRIARRQSQEPIRRSA